MLGLYARLWWLWKKLVCVGCSVGLRWHLGREGMGGWSVGWYKIERICGGKWGADL